MTTDVVLALLAAGLAVTVAAALGALTCRKAVTRLHFIAPITSLGFPLIGVALAVDNGWSLTTLQVLFIVGLLAVSGPVLGSATARVIAQREGMVGQGTPE